jgi:hypothetical protein
MQYAKFTEYNTLEYEIYFYLHVIRKKNIQIICEIIKEKLYNVHIKIIF